MIFPAHIRVDEAGVKTIQSVSEHCCNCARYASERAGAGLRKTAYLAGLIHDMGKYTGAFRDYITRAFEGEQVRRGSVNHTFAGVRFVIERWRIDPAPTPRNMTGEIIAAVIGSHHGLFDCIGSEGQDGFLHRLKSETIGYNEAKENFLQNCAQLDELDELFEDAQKEVVAAIGNCTRIAKSETESRFYLSFLVRQTLSAVIDADRRDTADFMSGAQPQPSSPTRLTSTLIQSRLDLLEHKLSGMSGESPINRARGVISRKCGEAALRGDGIYRLSVPTGGGKTLAGLRYALTAAKSREKKRIFFVIPLLSVLEQNAKVIREHIDDNSLILEHHSNLIQEKETTDELDRQELLLENWDAPIVVTTLVQLLNTLFAGKTSCIRRMHSLCDCIIVIDEVQSVPRKMLSLFNLAMNFLANCCGATIVLCSATQPCLEEISHPLRYPDAPDLVPYDPDLWNVFRRTKILDRRRKEGYSVEALADFALECQRQEGSLLLICNTKAQARTLFEAIKAGADVAVFHLSTAMCMAHRIQTMESINACLEKEEPVICVSTQLVEAGVDFSFGCVIRVSAGLDNIIQAAGRCNRSGEHGRLCPVYIVNIQGENLSRLKEIQESQTAAESVLALFEQQPDTYGNNLESVASVRGYYRRLFTDMHDYSRDYPLPEYDTTMFALLSDNRNFWIKSPEKPGYVITQAFRTAGEEFCVFDSATVDVLVPYGEGSGLIADLRSQEGKWNLAYRKELLAKAKSFTISLYDYEIKRLQQAAGISNLWDESILVLESDFYSEEIGLDYGSELQFMEV